MDIQELRESYKPQTYPGGSGHFGYESTRPYAAPFSLYCSPFFNCQNFSLANAGQFFMYLIPTNTTEATILKYLYDMTGRRLLMIDVNEDYVKEIKELLSTRTYIIDQPYVSTNGHNMHILYFNIT